jgi:hypothetical protein
MDYKTILGTIATLIAFASYVPYWKDILRGTTKPHPFSWFIYGITTLLIFFAQLTKSGGAGAWATGFSSIVCFAICIYAVLLQTQKRIFLIDWISLIGAIIALTLWVLIKDPTISVILLTCTTVLGSIPIYRKSIEKPFEETVSTFALGSLKFVFSIPALGMYSLATTLYPATLIIVNGSIAILLIARRKYLRN